MAKYIVQYIEVDIINKSIKFLEREKDIFIGENVILYRDGITEDTTQAARNELGFTYGAAVCIPEKNVRGFFRVYINYPEYRSLVKKIFQQKDVSSSNSIYAYLVNGNEERFILEISDFMNYGDKQISIIKDYIENNES